MRSGGDFLSDHWILFVGDSQEDNEHGIPEDPDGVREQLHLQNVFISIHQLLLQPDLHLILQCLGPRPMVFYNTQFF